VGTLTVEGFTFTVNQAGSCSYSLSRTNDTFTAAGGVGAPIAVSGAGACAWTAISDVAWIAVTSGANGAGNGTVTLSIPPNPGVSRSATVMIAGKVFSVSQAGPCVSSIDPTSQSMPDTGGAGSPVAISSAAGCT